MITPDWLIATRRRWLIPLGLSALTLLLYRWIGLWPLERYPNWDWVWGDARAANSLSALRRNLGSGQFPALDLRTNLGFDYVGDIYPTINPVNLLVAIVRPATVIWIRSAVVVVVGCCGAYFWLLRWARTSLAVVGAILYLSLPYLTGLSLFTTMGIAPFMLPILLITIEDLVEQVSWRTVFRLWMAIAVSVLCGDVNILFSIAPITILYGGGYGLIVRDRNWRDVGRAIGLAAATALVAATPLLVPLWANSKSTKASAALSLHLPPPSGGIDVVNFVKFNGGDSLIWPFEGSALLLYCPPVFILLGVVGLCVPGPMSSTNHRRRSLALMVLAVTVIVETVVVNNASVLRILGVSDPGARGVIRVHLNLLPYLLLLMGIFGCAHLIDRSVTPGRRWPVVVAACTVAISVAVDLVILGIHPTWYGKPLVVADAAHVPSSTLLRFPRSWDPVPLILGFHLLAALVVLAAARPAGAEAARRRFVVVGSLSTVAMLVTIGTVAAHLELLSRSSAQWHWVTNSGYRLDTFEDRQQCVEKLAHVNDPAVRVLYSGRDSLSNGSGGGYASLLELELAQASGQHPLFSFRELDLPIVGVYDGFFGVQRNSLLYPPETAAVARRASLLRLLGIRYLISSDATLANAAVDSGDFILLGACKVAQGPSEIRGDAIEKRFAAAVSGAGTSWVYEVERSSGIFSLACKNEVVSEATALSLVSSQWESVWERGVVWTEQPLADSASMQCADLHTAGQVKVLSEDGSDVRLRVESSHRVALVAAYAFRDGWSAFVDGHEVPVLRAYGGLMAISIPAGRHSVRFTYRSWSLPVGLMLFTLSGSVLFVGSRRSRRPQKVVE